MSSFEFTALHQGLEAHHLVLWNIWYLSSLGENKSLKMGDLSTKVTRNWLFDKTTPCPTGLSILITSQ